MVLVNHCDLKTPLEVEFLDRNYIELLGVGLSQLSGLLCQVLNCFDLISFPLLCIFKVKDLVARIHGKWQEIIQNCRPTQVSFY